MKKTNLVPFGFGIILLALSGCALDGGVLMTVGLDYYSPEPSMAVRLTSVEQRLPLAQTAAEDYQCHFIATQKLYEVGLGNLIDTVTSRRNAVSAELTIKELEQEKVSACNALYRAVGGSWEERQNQQVVSLSEGVPVKQETLPSNKMPQPSKQFSGKPS